MKDEDRNRMGDKFENEMKDLFERIGFTTEKNVFTNKKDGRKSEQDVVVTKGKLKIVVQCKDYAKFPFRSLNEVVLDLIEDGESLGANKLILAITGNKSLSEDNAKELKKKGVYFWNEEYWRKIQKLDLIDLYEEIGKNLEIKEVLKRVKDEEEQKLNSLYSKIEDIEDKNKRKLIFEQLEKLEFSDYTKRDIQLKRIENQIILEKEKEINLEQEKEKNIIKEKGILEELRKEGVLEKEELNKLFSELKLVSPTKREIILDNLEKLDLIDDLNKKRIQFEKIKNKILSEKEKEQDELERLEKKEQETKRILKNLEEEELIENEEIKKVFDSLDNLNPESQLFILEKIENLDLISDKEKKKIQFEKIKKEILIEKEEEIRGLNKNNKDNAEIEELLDLAKKLNYSRKQEAFDNILDLEFSKEDKRILQIEKLKEKLKEQEENSSVDEWGDKRLDDLEELRKSGKISFKEYIKLKEKAKQIGVSKSGISNSERKNFDYELNKAIFLKKIKKILIAIGIWGIATFILWRVLF